MERLPRKPRSGIRASREGGRLREVPLESVQSEEVTFVLTDTLLTEEFLASQDLPCPVLACLTRDVAGMTEQLGHSPICLALSPLLFAALERELETAWVQTETPRVIGMVPRLEVTAMGEDGKAEIWQLLGLRVVQMEKYDPYLLRVIGVGGGTGGIRGTADGLPDECSETNDHDAIYSWLVINYYY